MNCVKILMNYKIIIDYCRWGLVIMMRSEPVRKVLKLSKLTPYSFFLRRWEILAERLQSRIDFFVLLYQDKRTKKIRCDFYRMIVFFFITYPTFFSAKKVAKKLESGMRSFSPILRLDPFGDFYRTTSRCPSLSSIQSFSYASFHFKK